MDDRLRLLSVSDVVGLTGLSERSIRGLVASGRLRAVRPAGLRVVRIPERAVLELLGTSAQGPTGSDDAA